MRLRVQLDNPHGASIPVNHQEFLTAAVYALLETSDADYARFLHDEGYKVGDGPKAFKFFTFSGLRSNRRRVEGDTLRLAPGPVEWLLGSPVDDFLTHAATGLLSAGALRVGNTLFPITEVQTLPAPALAETTEFRCLTPIVAALPLENGGTRYLRPSDGDEFSEAVRRNLRRKFETLFGHPPSDDRLALTFDPDYLDRDPRGGTKLITYKGIRIVGAFCPFTATGSLALMQALWDCGAGEKNAAGFGMVDIRS